MTARVRTRKLTGSPASSQTRSMKRVVIESPLRAENRDRNKRYARLCILDCLLRGEAPFASHALYDHEDILDDDNPNHRMLGIQAGYAWVDKADLVAAYIDLGESSGMKDGIARAQAFGIAWERRALPPELFDRLDTP